ncbi:hypothetical protein L9F63_001490, partial [Diploptera punctata]
MDYPDPEEEFELMHAEELEMMREMEEDLYPGPDVASKSKRSLDFSSPKQASEPPQESQLRLDTRAKSPIHPLLPHPSSAPHRRSLTPLHPPLCEIRSNETVDDHNFSGTSAGECSILKDAHLHAHKKRKVEELFGDISDIYQDDTLMECRSSKKRKEATLESDAQLIARIKTQRQIQKQAQNVVSDFHSADINKSSCGVTSRVPSYPFVPVTLSNGDRMYARLRTEQYMEQQIGNITAQSRTAGLLSVPYQTVWEQVQEYILKRTEAVEEVDAGCEVAKDSDLSTADLWVEKYKPRKYIELLSDEGANRTILHWLKLWDKVVFNRERKVKQRVKEDDKKAKNFTFDTSGKVRLHLEKKFQKAVLNKDLDEHGCPQQKIALLCGPPGLGKTTLAHVVGLHAGYNVVEMNASDDRSPEVFRTQLEAATQMKAVMGTSPRPNCLILDEIDGAPAQSIDVLIKFVTGKLVKSKKKGQTSAGSVLKRPVICICNDIYVPALRALRQIALIVPFPPTDSSRLAQRLMEISRKQRIRTDMGALMALADKTSNDIRSCLSVLHFFKSQKKDIRVTDVQKNNIGQKDIHKGLFAVWQDIFQIHRPKRGMSHNFNKHESYEIQFGDTSLGSRMQYILRSVQCCGDYDRLAQGVYENFPNLTSRDSHLDIVCFGLEWFCLSDVFSHKIKTTQNYVLLPYQPYSFVMWHFLFASYSWPKITYPNTGYEVMVREQRCKQVVKELMEGMSPIVRVHSNPAHLLFDTLSPLLQILVPTLRPVSSHLYSTREMHELNHIVSIMIDYNLNYVQERTQEGGYVYKLNPYVEDLTLFPGVKQTRFLSYAAKQLIAREVDLEKLRRAEKQFAVSAPISKKSAGNAPALPDQQLKPKPIIEMPSRNRIVRLLEFDLFVFSNSSMFVFSNSSLFVFSNSSLLAFSNSKF